MPKQIITFDFDDTLCMSDGTPNMPMLDLVRKYAEEGFKCYIVTARNKKHESLKWMQKNSPNRVAVKDFIKEYDLPIKQCHFTNHEPKGPVLNKIGSIKHYDDHDEQIESAKEYGIEAIHPKDIVPE